MREDFKSSEERGLGDQEPGKPASIAYSRDPWVYWLVLWILCICSFLLRNINLNFGLPAGYRPDEEIILGAAIKCFNAHCDPNYIIHPSLYFYLTTVWLIVGEMISSLVGMSSLVPTQWSNIENASSALHWCRYLNVISGVLVVWFSYPLARRFLEPRYSLSACAIIGCHGMLVRSSQFLTLDMPLTLAVVLLLTQLVDLFRYGGRFRILGIGFGIGLAISIKYTAASLAVIAVAVIVLRILCHKGSWSEVWYSFEALPLGFLGFATGSPYIAFNLRHLIYIPLLLAYFSQFGTNPDLIIIPLGWSWVWNFVIEAGIGVGWLTLALVQVPLLIVSLVRGYRDSSTSYLQTHGEKLLLLLFILVTIAPLATTNYAFIRYAMPIIPTVGILVVLTLRDLLSKWGYSNVRRWLIANLVLCILSFTEIHSFLDYATLLGERDTRTLASAWFVEHVPLEQHILAPGKVGYVRYDLPTLTPHAFVTYDQLVDSGRSLDEITWVLSSAHPVLTNYTSRHNPEVQQLLDQYGVEEARSAPEIRGVVQQDVKFDILDAFFTPWTGCSLMKRPGPQLVLHRIKRAGPP